jgi:hypothetical protein
VEVFAAATQCSVAYTEFRAAKNHLYFDSPPLLEPLSPTRTQHISPDSDALNAKVIDPSASMLKMQRESLYLL